MCCFCQGEHSTTGANLTLAEVSFFPQWFLHGHDPFTRRSVCPRCGMLSYISSKLAGQKVTLSIQAKEQKLQVVYPPEYRRSLPLKGLHQRALPYQQYLALMQREASTQQRLLALGRWKGRSD